MRATIPKKLVACVALCVAILMVVPRGLSAGQDENSPNPAQAPPDQQRPQSAPLTPEQLQDLVAPIALYPDALVAQILAASAYPTQIVEAERFLQQNPGLNGQALAAEVDKQDWDPSVKALTAFPTVLANLDKNLAWTSELGDANVNQQEDVMNAVQLMRKKAEDAGNLKTTPQQNVTNNGSAVVIQPANPQVVYVPDYDPELIYGYPVALWPGFYPWWGVGGPYLSFGVGFGIGPFFGFGWGWPAWGFDWYHRGILFGGGIYGFHGPAFYNRNAYFHGNYRGFAAPYARGDRTLRGYGAPSARPNTGTRSGAFNGFSRGADARAYSSRGRSSFGGGGGFGGGARGGGGGGGGRGGGRR